MKKATLLTLALLTLPALAAPQAGRRHTPQRNRPVASAPQAVERVSASVARHRLTSLKAECLTFVEADETPTAYQIDVHEKHNAQCGGDPQTAPRLFSYTVEKASGRMTVDDPISGETRPID